MYVHASQRCVYKQIVVLAVVQVIAQDSDTENSRQIEYMYLCNDDPWPVPKFISIACFLLAVLTSTLWCALNVQIIVLSLQYGKKLR